MAGAGKSGPLLGRGVEVAEIGRRLALAVAGRGQMVLVEGEAGIGKTRLVRDSVTAARATVLEGSCADLDQTRAFAPIAEALGVRLDAPEPERGRLAALLTRGAGATEPLASATPDIQFQLLDGLGALVEQMANAGPVVLVIEDLHWADSSTLTLLRWLMRRIDHLAMAIVGTFRPGHGLVALDRLVDDALRAGQRMVRVERLSPVTVVELATQLIGEPPGPELLRTLDGAGGNPFVVTELIRSLADAHALSIECGRAELRQAGAPIEFRQTVLRRLSDLSERTRTALQLGSVLGPTFSASELAVAMESSPLELLAVLEPAIASGVLGDAGDRVAFRHALVREAIYEDIPRSLRLALHRQVAEALAAAGAGADRIAPHVGVSAVAGDVEAVGILRQGARDVLVRSPLAAVELLERARQLVGTSGPGASAVVAELSIALGWSGRLAEAEALATQEATREAPDSSRLVGLHAALASALIWQGQPREALLHLRRLLDDPLALGDRVVLLARAALASVFADDLGVARLQATEAADGARQLGDVESRSEALCALAWANALGGDVQHGAELAHEAVQVARAAGNHSIQAVRAQLFLGLPLILGDRLDEAEEALQTGRRQAEDAGLAWQLPMYHGHLGTRRYMSGEWDDAVAECETSASLGDELDLSMAVIFSASGRLANIAFHRGDLESAEATVAEAEALVEARGPQLGFLLVRHTRALLLEASGFVEEAKSVLQALWDAQVDAAVVRSFSVDLVRLCVVTGDSSQATALLPKIDEISSRLGTAGGHAEGLLCRAMVQADPVLFAEAVGFARRSGRPFLRAAACEAAATDLAARGHVADARGLFREAVTVYDELGAVRDSGRVAATLRRYGIRLGVRRRQARATIGWDSLTATERKVVGFVAQGFSNPEIGDRMFISRRTVETHLKHVFSKLDVSSRTELAAQAARRAN